MVAAMLIRSARAGMSPAGRTSRWRMAKHLAENGIIKRAINGRQRKPAVIMS